MNNLTRIIHKLEEECYWTAKNIVLHSEADWFKERFELYDLYQTIITILEKIDEGKIKDLFPFNFSGWSQLGTQLEKHWSREDLAKSLTDWLGGGDGHK